MAITATLFRLLVNLSSMWRPRLIDRPQWSSSRGGVMIPADGVAKSNGGTWSEKGNRA